MKKFVFTLGKMLSYKSSLYERERNELARLRRERAELEARREEVRRQLAEMENDFRQRAQQGVDVAEMQKVAYFRKNTDCLIELLTRQMMDLDVRIERQLAIVIKLDQDVQGLEKLREKQWEEYTAEANREEAERISEQVSGKYIEAQNQAIAEELAEAKAAAKP